MQDQSRAGNAPNPVDLFGEKLAASLAGGSFVRLVLSNSSEAADGLQRVLGRMIELKNEPHLSLTLRYSTRDETKNLSASDGAQWIKTRLESQFRSGLLCTTEGDWQIAIQEGRAQLIRHKASSRTAPVRSHDQPRESILDESAQPWLHALQITDASGKLRPSRTDKYRQISRYVEILCHLAKDCGWADDTPERPPEESLVVVDMGCGSGYLTFGVWHLFHQILKRPVRVLGVEVRASLTAKADQIAKSMGAPGLEFVCGSIESVKIPNPDALIALHACDTATDHAIVRGIESGARLILLAPCCHKEVRPLLGRPTVLAPLLRHGFMEERLAEWLTDGVRALFLEWAGYRTKIIEFVSSEHTAKNLMIAAIRADEPFGNPAIRARILELKSFFGLEAHSLDRLLTREPIAD